MLTRKQVVSDQAAVYLHLSTTSAQSKTEKGMLPPVVGSAGGLRQILRAKRQVPSGTNSSSMMSLLKTRENQGQGANTKTKRPVLFGAIG